MNTWVTALAEGYIELILNLGSGWIPDTLLRHGIRTMCTQRLSEVRKSDIEEELRDKMDYIRKLTTRSIAEQTPTANKQHYEVPTEFFQQVMGRNMK